VNEGVNRASGSSPVEHPALPPENLAESFFHKLSQPIGAIYASLELGLMSDDAKQLKAAIEAGLTQLERLRWLFQIAREFFATDFCARARSISLRECIQTAVNDSRPLAEAKKISFVVSADEDLHLLADPGYLCDAIENLVNWCIRKSPHTGVIKVAALGSAATAQIEISDDSSYYPELASNIFEPFPPGVPIRPGESGNLDIALSQRIIQTFGGEVELRATPNGKNCFRIVLPRHNS
jgi:two-component system sensor histidine kinase SenX3